MMRWAPGLRWALELQTLAANSGCSHDWQVFQSIGENSNMLMLRLLTNTFLCKTKVFFTLWLTLFSSFVMAKESAGSDRLRSERYANSLFSNSGSGGFSVSSWDGTVADGAGLSLLAVELSVRLPLSAQMKRKLHARSITWQFFNVFKDLYEQLD